LNQVLSIPLFGPARCELSTNVLARAPCEFGRNGRSGSWVVWVGYVQPAVALQVRRRPLSGRIRGSLNYADQKLLCRKGNPQVATRPTTWWPGAPPRAQPGARGKSQKSPLVTPDSSNIP